MLAAPTAILADERSRVRAIRCIRMELGEPDASGRRSPVPVKGSEFDIEVDTVVFAIGQGANPLIRNTTPGPAREQVGQHPRRRRDRRHAEGRRLRRRRHRDRRRDGHLGDGRRPQGRARHRHLPAEPVRRTASRRPTSEAVARELGVRRHAAAGSETRSCRFCRIIVVVTDDDDPARPTLAPAMLRVDAAAGGPELPPHRHPAVRIQRRRRLGPRPEPPDRARRPPA